MDYTKVPREIIYRDRIDIDEFDVDKKYTINGWFLDHLKTRSFIQNEEKAVDYALRIFNDAYYICTLFMANDHEELHFAHYLSIAAHNKQDEIWTKHCMPATLALVYNLMLPYSKEWGGREYKNPYEKFRKYIWRHFGGDIKSALGENDDFFDLIQYTPIVKESAYDFEIRHLPEAIETLPVQKLAEGIDYVIGDILGQVEPKLLLKLYHKLNSVDNKDDGIKDAITSTEKAMRIYDFTIPGDSDESMEDHMMQITDLQERNMELEKEVNNLKQQLQELNASIENLSAAQKVRMEFACKLLEKAGMTKDVLTKHGNKQKAAQIMSMLLDINNSNSRNNAAQTCATYLSARDLSRNKHEDIVEELNKLLRELNIDVQL